MIAEQAARDLGGIGLAGLDLDFRSLERLAVLGGGQGVRTGSISTASGPSWVSMPFADLSMREVPSSASALTLAAATAFLMETSAPASARTARLPAALPIEISSSVFQA
ncbi:MAG: hypothetical protein ACLT98_02520 [Eggerthellaceae bacterium]